MKTECGAWLRGRKLFGDFASSKQTVFQNTRHCFFHLSYAIIPLCSFSRLFWCTSRVIWPSLHCSTLTQFGSIWTHNCNILGGRNTTVSLQSRTGHTNMQAVVGLLVFQQFWWVNCSVAVQRSRSPLGTGIHWRISWASLSLPRPWLASTPTST